MGSNCIRIWRQKDYSCTRTSHEYWIMHVIFDRHHMTVLSKYVVVASKTRYRLTLGGWCLVISRYTTCSILALVHWCLSARVTVSTNWYHTATLKQVLAFKETVLSAGTAVVKQVGRRNSNKTVVPSASVPWDGTVYIFAILWCIMTQLKFYNCHMKRSESDWYCQPQGSGSQQFELG